MDDLPDVTAGGYFDQAGIVGSTEGLQDFRRRQEGHLIIADDRPLLVMSFGTKYEGAQASKYKIEGKYDIPVGYKVIIKWDEDEIVFMTRQGTFGPEYQIVYLPKSAVQEDFTVFEWNPNIGEIWDQFMTVSVDGRDERDMKIFNQGPWHTFGVKRDEVQIALKQGIDNKTKVDGVLYCADGVAPDLLEHMRYLGFDPTTDEDFVWICHAFKDEPKPSHFSQWVSKDGMVYWVDARTQEATWKHPHFDKYDKMLKVARTQKPYPKWQHVLAFRIEFMFSQIFTWQCELSGEYPPVETIENVVEFSRMFGVDIEREPYLVHVLKRALRHYGQVVKDKRKVKDVEDFRNLMRRYRELVNNYERQKDEENKKIQEWKVCVQCPDNSKKDAVLFCDQCRDFFCQGCFDKIHSRGRRQNHRRSWVELGMCAECAENVAHFHCTQCSDLYCRDCFQEWHVRGGRRNHIPIVLRQFNSQTNKLPEANYALATNAAQNLAKARSPWFEFLDEHGIKLYYDIVRKTAQRDMPLAILNEPIDEHIGGGLAGGWAGTWGSNMFGDSLENTTHSQTHGMSDTAF